MALEACYGWYWAADLLQAPRGQVHLVHPLGLHWDSRRVKNDVKDATELAKRLRRDDLPEAWVAPPEVRRAARARPLPGQAGGPAHLGQGPGPRGDGQAGDPASPRPTCSAPAARCCWTRWPSTALRLRVESLRDLMEVFDREIAMVERQIHRWLGRPRLPGHPGPERRRAGHGRDLRGRDRRRHRFPAARHLCSWAGHDPQAARVRHKSHRGRITKQGSTIVRWAAVESVARYHGGDPIAPAYRRIAERRGERG